MFRTPFGEKYYSDLIPEFKAVFIFLEQLDYANGKDKAAKVYESVKADILNRQEGPEDILNDLFVIGRVARTISCYVEVWEQIGLGQFSKSWLTLQDCADYLRQVKRYSMPPVSGFLAFIENQVVELEKLYPYDVFFSVGMTVDLFECSVCGKDMDSFDCPHLRGELHRGNIAYGIAKKITKLDHVSMVLHPEDKRCVAEFKDNAVQFNIVRNLSEFVASRQMSPLAFNGYSESEDKVKNPEYKQLGRNALCACGSGKKFKKCCVDKEYVTKHKIYLLTEQTTVNNIFEPAPIAN